MILTITHFWRKIILMIFYASLVTSIAKCTPIPAETTIDEDSVIIANPIFTILWDDYFSTKNLQYNSDEVDKYIPTSIFLDKYVIGVPNNYLNRIELYTKSGKFERYLSFDGGNIDVGKIFLSSKLDSIFVLDKEIGLSIFNSSGKLIYSDEHTEDIIFDLGGENIIFENSLNDQRAILDIKGSMRTPLLVDYFNASMINNKVYGLKFNDGTFDHPFTIEEIDIVSGDIKVLLTNNNDGCYECFMFPKLFGKEFIIASNHEMDFIHFLKDDTLSYSAKLEFPKDFEVIRNFEFADLIYSGFAYQYNASTKMLYAIGSSSKGVTVFKFDLSKRL